MTTPTADAIRLAVKLSGHTGCCLALQRNESACDGCLADAATIDRELLLPEKNAALFLAQGAVDASKPMRFGNANVPQSAIDELREALAKLKTL